MEVVWKGVFPALLTPFTKSGQLDLGMFEKNLGAQVDAGIHGIIIGGSLGEASTITEKEKQEMVRFAVEYLNGRLPVILNIAESATTEAVTKTSKAREWGADGIMLLPPMRYKSDDRETVKYFRTVATSTSLPVMIYNNPFDYRIDAHPQLFDQLLDCENIQALKESSRDVTNLTRMINRFGNRFSILCGVDTLALEELCLGAGGWVAGLVCAFPKETVLIYELAKSGKIKEARDIYRWFMPLLELDIHSKLVQYIKLAATETGLGTEYVRAPRLELEGEERERILKIIRESISKRPA
jgi:1-pyrroline-4-hydroxy-2-carboxylate deaminase